MLLRYCYVRFSEQTARLTWWTRHDKQSDTDVMEEARDEEVEMQRIPEEDNEKAEEEEAKGVTDETPAVNTKIRSK